MLGHLIRKEMLDHFLGFRFLILSALAGLVIWLSLFSGYSYYRGCLRDYRLAQEATEGRLRRIQAAPGMWEELQKISFEVHKPPTLMSIFVRGLEPVLGRSVLSGSSLKLLKQSPATTEPILGVFPSLDLGSVVQLVLSLFVLLFTYDAICGEKEGGTLRLTSSFRVGKDQLLLAKFLGVLLPIYVACGVPLALGLGVIFLLPEVQITSPEYLRLGLILAAFAAYLAAFACAGVLASCVTHRPSTSFVILLAFWVVAVIILPRVSLIAAETVRPAITRHQHMIQVDKLGREQAAESRRLRWKWRDEHPDYFRGTPEAAARAREAFNNYYRQMEEELTAKYKPMYARLDEEFSNRYNRRQALADLLARSSPAFALKNATVRLAETGLGRQQRFEQAYDRYSTAYSAWNWAAVERFNKKASNEAKGIKYEWTVADMPRLVYRETWPREDIRNALIDIGALAVWGLAFFYGAYRAMWRYDPR